MICEKTKNGFTLIELLIVLVIVSVTSGIIVMTNIQTQMKKSRDMQRKTDLARIKVALEMYKTDNNVYPLIGGSYTWNIANNLTDLSSGNYLNPIPADPSSGNSCPGYLVAVAAQAFTIYLALENTNDASVLATKPTPVVLPTGSTNNAGLTVTIDSNPCASSIYNYWINSR